MARQLFCGLQLSVGLTLTITHDFTAKSIGVHLCESQGGQAHTPPSYAKRRIECLGAGLFKEILREDPAKKQELILVEGRRDSSGGPSE